MNLTCLGNSSENKTTTKAVTVQTEEGFGVEIVRVEPIRLLPHLFQLILTALKDKNKIKTNNQKKRLIFKRKFQKSLKKQEVVTERTG